MFKLFGLLLVGLALTAHSAVANILPNVSVEEQYRFALGKALENDLVTAEKAFKEFGRVNSGHSRHADSIFWLGRVQFQRGKYEHAAMTFSEFGSAFPDDQRIPKTTLWIAVAVSHFAPPDQACEIYGSLPQLIDNPKRAWLQELAALAADAPCDNKIIASLGGMPTKKSQNTDFLRYSDKMLCTNLRLYSNVYAKEEAKRRGLNCSLGETTASNSTESASDLEVCQNYSDFRDRQGHGWKYATRTWEQEADRRGLNCFRVLADAGRQNSGSTELDLNENDREHFQYFKRRGIQLTDSKICSEATRGGKPKFWRYDYKGLSWVQEAKSRGLTCGVVGTSSTQIASSNTTQSNTPSSAELEAERQKRIQLEQQLAALKAQREQQQQTVSNDTKLPTITIASATTKGAQGIIRGHVNDNTGIAELRVDGQKIAVDTNGNFSATTYVPEGGTSVNIEAIDLAGLSSTMSVRVDRAATQTASISFDRLNPLKRKALPNKDAIALIIGIAKYKNTENSAYADKDALVFRDYATEKLGIPGNQIKTLINEKADIGEVLLSIRKWIRRSTKPNKTDVYVFYAGHGIATAAGEAYILPYDGRPEVDLLDRTALLQKELFAEIEKANPRNVTIFLDACYTGKARTGEILMADANYRPIAIRPIDDGMPDKFTLITASSGDEFSGPLEEAKHGLFSYFLMKGMEGDADSNQDNKITSGELHEYVKENVLRQSADKQTPELQGDADKVLVRFQ